jgi:DNA (cytosine-5)-methyltransferase 1
VSNTTFRFVDLFAGIGGFNAVLTGMGGDCVYAVEIDPASAAVYQRNWGIDPYGDVRLDANDDRVNVPAHDLLAAGFPCQPFSKSGAQRDTDETRGTFYWNILKIIQAHHPSVVLLENVPNIAGLRHAHEWQVMVETLRAEGYQVADSPAVFSPHLLPPKLGGRPQVRHRVFLTATYDPNHLAGGAPAEPVATLLPVAGWDPRTWHFETDVPLDPDHDVRGCDLTDAERLWIDAWDDFVTLMWEEREGLTLPGFPLWADQWVTTDHLDIPEETPAWKASLLIKNAEFYTADRVVIDRWTHKWGIYTNAFPSSRRKLEWQAGDTPRLWDCVLNFRPSGIRARRPTCLPALNAVTQTSVIGSRERRLSHREAAHLQGLPEWFDFGDQPRAVTYRQLGNCVSIGAVWHVLKKHAERDRDILKTTNPALLQALLTAPDNPDEVLSTLHDAGSGWGTEVTGGNMSAEFIPAVDKLDAVNRISALTGSGPQALGPGSKERKSVLTNLATGLGLTVAERLSKPMMAAQIAGQLGQPWGHECWSRGQTITLRGLNRLLEGAEHRVGAAAVPIMSVTVEATKIVETMAAATTPTWDGRDCIQQMRDAGDTQWAQDHWQGFYLEFLAGTCTSLGGHRNKRKYGKTVIDYELIRPWDFKTHSVGTKWAILNDKEGLEACLDDCGGIGFVIMTAEPVRDADGTFRPWQKQLRLDAGKKARKSPKDPPPKPNNRVKAAFYPRRLQAFYFTAEQFAEAVRAGVLKEWKQPPQQSGEPRGLKYQLNVKAATAYLVAEFDFTTTPTRTDGS